MPAISGKASKTLKVSTDDTVANLKELKDFIDQWVFVFQDGESDRPFQGGEANDLEFLLENHSINIAFRPETGADQNILLLLTGTRGTKRKFDFQVEADAVNSKGFHAEGSCYVVRGRAPFNSDRRVQADVVLRMAGSFWVIDDDTS